MIHELLMVRFLMPLSELHYIVHFEGFLILRNIIDSTFYDQLHTYVNGQKNTRNFRVLSIPSCVKQRTWHSLSRIYEVDLGAHTKFQFNKTT